MSVETKGCSSYIPLCLQNFIRRLITEPPIEPISAFGLLINADIATDSLYYSGIPGCLKDIDGQKLMHMFCLLSTRNGKMVATDFAKMINDMPSLAGSNVVQATYALERNNWVYNPEKILPFKMNTRPIDISGAVDPDHYALLIGLGQRTDIADETGVIKLQFINNLRASGIDIEGVTNVKSLDESNLS